jgi:hypothetical protein
MRRVLPLLAVSCLLACPDAHAIQGNNDPQIWIAVKLLAPLAEQLRLRAEFEDRIGDGMRRLYSWHGDLGLSIKAYDEDRFSVIVDLMYRQAFHRDWFWDTPLPDVDADGWYAEYRPYGAVTASVRLGRFTLGLSLNLEGRLFDRIRDQLRLGNGLFAAYDAVASNYSFRMFLDARITSILHPDADFFRTRIYAGFMFPIHKALGLNVYYMWERYRIYPGWWNWNVLGTAVTFTFS